MQERPMPDDDAFRDAENPDLEREHDADAAGAPDEGDAGAEDRPTIEPDDATPTEDPGISPI